MEMTSRRRNIVILACLALITTGFMLWSGDNPIQPVVDGVNDWVKNRKKDTPTPVPVPAPVPVKNDTPAVPAPAPPRETKQPEKASPPVNLKVVSPEPTKNVSQLASDAVPRGATREQVEAVAGVFSGLAVVVSKREPVGGKPWPYTVSDVVAATNSGMVGKLGDARTSWVLFTHQINDALDTYRKTNKLSGPDDLVRPWTDIASGMRSVAPR